MIKKMESDLDFFKETFCLINQDIRMFKYRLQHSKNFDQSQKKLLRSLLHYKKGEKEEMLELVKTAPLDSPFLEATRLYLLGTAQNHFNHFAYAIKHLEQAVELYKQLEEKTFVLFPLTALIVTLGNQRKIDLMAEHVDYLKTLTPTQDNLLLALHSEAYYLILSAQWLKAEDLLKRAMKRDNEKLGLFKPGFLIMLFSISFQKQDYKTCYKHLEEYKKSNGFTVKINYQYMKTLLDHLVEKKPIYAYASDYKDFPELYHQIEVIKALSKADVDSARRFWGILNKHNPGLYQASFTYKGETGLFSSALTLYKDHADSTVLDYPRLSEIDSPMERLDYILSTHSAPISKADLIQLIWEEEISEVSMGRLRKLIYSYRKNKGKDVVSYQDTYQVKKSA